MIDKPSFCSSGLASVSDGWASVSDGLASVSDCWASVSDGLVSVSDGFGEGAFSSVNHTQL